MGWLKEPLANIQGQAMELEAQAAIRNMARQQARAQGLPVKHVIGEAERGRRQPIDIDAETMPAPDGLDHWYGEARNPATPTGLGEAGELSRERQDFEDALEAREEKRRKKERAEALKAAQLSRERQEFEEALEAREEEQRKKEREEAFKAAQTSVR